MHLTEVPVTADSPYRCTEEAARLRFTMNGTDAAAVNLTGRFDWARTLVTPPLVPSPPVPAAAVEPSAVPAVVLALVMLVQAWAKALKTFSAPAVALLYPPTSSATTLMVYMATDTGILGVVAAVTSLTWGRNSVVGRLDGSYGHRIGR